MGNEVSVHALMTRAKEFQLNFSTLEKNLLSEFNLTHSSFLILQLLIDERLTLTELTELSPSDKSTLSRQVNALVKKEWVLKEQGEDKRYTYLTLSNEAELLVRNIQFELEKKMTSIFKSWPTDEKQLLLVLLGRANRSMQLTDQEKKL